MTEEFESAVIKQVRAGNERAKRRACRYFIERQFTIPPGGFKEDVELPAHYEEPPKIGSILSYNNEKNVFSVETHIDGITTKGFTFYAWNKISTPVDILITFKSSIKVK